MQFGTIRHGDETRAVRLNPSQGQVEVLDSPDVGNLLLEGVTNVGADGEILDLNGVEWAPLVTRPNKIICVGLNYRDHVEEMGRELPSAPTYFSKFSGALIGANDDLHLPPRSISTHNDWEAELAMIIGARARDVNVDDAYTYIAGFTVFNDFSVRDYQRRTTQFLAGKTFENASGLGPVLVLSLIHI